MPYLDRGASRLYYETHGEGAPLVLLHGVGGNHASWFHQVVAWRDTGQVITFDARGFGNSSDVEGLGRAAFANDLEALLDHLQLPRVALIAQSMGGGAAVPFTVRHPERVRALVLADTLVGLTLPDDLAARMQAIAARTANLSQLERVLGPTFMRAQPAQSYLYTALASFNDTNVRTLRGVQPMTSLEELDACGVPVLFVAGNEDVLFPPREIEAAQRTMTHADYLEIDAAGHSAYFEAPHVFNEQVFAWLQAQP
ncbi:MULTISPECIES: alpha/beta hydrolase [unclassified Caballeronia]|uniref:alpha/beta fold hydrolase n=1 Tax=unclassified Caballeronia TaxID=2646786 RepID=UPI00285EE06F|nr:MULTISPECIES: alpha/beta hydrolase [unclassified Caballeronia]MDR5815670.1 alpha/beta hydrolase [Caballeronia sp. LZ033]MDR5822243.1 alpha/beta hydrolase [Caballeronia sp. LZ043]MDR5880399.1 alpha/beta hydrolase [Caballeronia sp. LZ032]